MRALQIILPFFIAGIGTCFSGIFLDHVQYWAVFIRVEEIFIVLPAILGLKGNLQMTLASRFSTHSHLGHMESRRELLSLAFCNIALNQCFSIVISVLASILSITIHYASSDRFNPKYALLVTATALLTSSLTSFLLDILMIMVVQVSALYNINPDNVATPIASSLGDLLALLLCAFLSKAFFEIIDITEFYYLTTAFIAFCLLLTPILMIMTHDNSHTANILCKKSYWCPLLSAMVISTTSGLILKAAVARYADIALFTPIICGVGGNLVAVQASRLASLLHQTTTMGVLPEGETICMNPWMMIVSNKPGFSITRLLMVIVLPGQVIFFYFCLCVNPQFKQPTTIFLILYLIASQVHVIFLLYLAYVLTYTLWSIQVDPDNATIPYLTSISDVNGAFLITFICLVAVPSK